MREFRSLASMLTAPQGEPKLPQVEEALVLLQPLQCSQNDAVVHAEVIAEAKRFRAQLREALEEAQAHIAAELRNEVLARELALSPSDIGAIARDLLARYREHEPVRLRVHPDRRLTLGDLGIAITEDAGIGCDDVYLDLRNGYVDATLAARLQA